MLLKRVEKMNKSIQIVERKRLTFDKCCWQLILGPWEHFSSSWKYNAANNKWRLESFSWHLSSSEYTLLVSMSRSLSLFQFYLVGEAGMNSWTHGPPHMAVQKQDDQHEHTFSSYVRIRDVVLKTYLGRWTIGRSGERGSGISVLPARDDDDDDDI